MSWAEERILATKKGKEKQQQNKAKQKHSGVTQLTLMYLALWKILRN